MRTRGASPAGAVLAAHDGVEADIRSLWGAMSALPILVLAPSPASVGPWAVTLGALIARQDHAQAARAFVRGAVDRIARMHLQLLALARSAGLSGYEADLAWRWILGQRRERDLLAALNIKKATLAQRRRAVLMKTGAASSGELASWIDAR